MLAEGRKARKLALWKEMFEREKKMESAGRSAAQVDVKKEQAVIFFKGNELRHVEPRVVQQFVLALQVEIEQAFGGAVRSDDSGAEACLFGLPRKFSPVFVVAN